MHNIDNNTGSRRVAGFIMGGYLAGMMSYGLAQTVPVAPTPAAAPAPCTAPEYRAFDFWLGEWEVKTPDGKLAGYNRIEREYGGCVIHERYTTTPRPFAGESLNAYDAARGVWHQTWMDNSGTVLLLDGKLEGKSMVLQGRSLDSQGKSQIQRISWTPNQDGSVRQHWQAADEKGGWTTVFDGIYRKKQ